MSLRVIPVRMLVGIILLASHAAAAGPGCARISGFDQYVSHARGIFVGDMHGTVEAPAFVTDLVCNLTHSGRAVALGLEYPRAEQHFIDEFLHERTDDPRPALLSSPFWIRPTQDGRTSQAMLKLLYSVRTQIRSGARIRLIAFDAPSTDEPPTGPLDGTAVFDRRDAAMAEYLRHELSTLSPADVPIIFTGNVHARKTKGLQALNAPPGMENAEPLGYRLRDLGFLDINIDYKGGSLWTCFSPSDCGVHDGGERGPKVKFFSVVPSTDPAYDLKYWVGRLTASPPAATKKYAQPRSATLFNGTFYANEPDSKMLPGQHVPTNYVGIMRDDGVLLRTTQTFTAGNGEEIKRVWDGVCNGNPSQVTGAPVGVQLSCVRAPNGSLVTTLSDAHRYRHVETCALSARGRRETCSGTAVLPDGSKHDFVYVFDQR